ncbi:uncharacterized protein DUF2752 [Stackebrandtia albiflava]|uniref:Uncharacterized protein DUF2752 n=1 Tax=Stackebrandtia albiflava TaxID=406432 RepID=A0A562VH42_9ACTN|nr:DUF2752 domain-containing protein [Stackebrandtia albiflava]TWJ17161.1 uncharacterized protein DUF2752 [Stackebrandtia albiflava]
MPDQMSTPTRELPVVPATPGPFPGYPPVAPGHGQAWQRPPAPGRVARFFGRIRRAPAWVAPAALLTCFAGAAAAVVATDPTDDLGPTTCAFKMVTGFDCPGCGGTRAFYYVLTLNLPEAARNHALAVFAAPFLVYLYLTWTLDRVVPRLGRRLPKLKVTGTTVAVFMMAWGVYWVVRNLPWAPFTALYV